MSRGRNNQLTGQVAEHLVVAELGRRGLAATGFSGNIQRLTCWPLMRTAALFLFR